ncbi:hypothetical protein [Hyphococcus sp.]|uniref:hypothetical protein n=1 Tax=Hyphococcus sp. TaxID=2038636 RepID=UPI00208636F6|nr:MAG: hypothetical protein DHS20C04_13920 [Marinicaulis sp.]
MKKGIFTTAAATLALTALSATGAYAGKTADIVAPLAVASSPVQNADELSAAWVDGRRQEVTGLDQVKAGEKLIRKGQKAERKATDKLAKLVAVSDEQKAAYVRLVTSFGGAATPMAVETEIKALKKAADDWSDAYGRVEKAQAKLTEAQADIANGQSAMRTGNESIAVGREKMRRAETQSHPEYRATVAPNTVAPKVDASAVELVEIN